MMQLLVHVITSIIEKKMNDRNLFGELEKKGWNRCGGNRRKKEHCAGHSRRDEKSRRLSAYYTGKERKRQDEKMDKMRSEILVIFFES